MQRITADLIQNSRAFYNPLKERQLDLRGYKLLVIENLGAMEDQFDTLDLSDNEIKKLDNFPRMTRLRTVLLSNNHITRIDARAGGNLAHLEHLVLTHNRIANFSDLDALAAFPSLTTLSLVENPVTLRPNYRLYAIHKLPQVRAVPWLVCRGPCCVQRQSLSTSL
jgi:U2 small nuclear ribonucleoprotein A'